MAVLPPFRPIPKSEQRVESWKNGGGTTRTVAIDPPGSDFATGFRWRISVADVAVDGPFSVLPGLDRSLWLLAGNGVVLSCGGSATVLREPLQRLDFVGEAAITAARIDGPVRDVNVMTRRGEVAAVAFAGAAFEVAPAPQQVVLALRGGAEVRIGNVLVHLEEGDALRADAPITIVVDARDGAALGVGFFAARR